MTDKTIDELLDEYRNATDDVHDIDTDQHERTKAALLTLFEAGINEVIGDYNSGDLVLMSNQREQRKRRDQFINRIFGGK